MKHTMFLMILLLGFKQAFSQATNTNLTKCYSPAQVDEIYKGLKQGEYLKTRVIKAEETLLKADVIINEQKSINSKLSKSLALSEEITLTNELAYKKDKELCEYKTLALQNTIDINKAIYKKDKRKAIWSGIKIGGVSVAVLGTAAFFLLR